MCYVSKLFLSLSVSLQIEWLSLVRAWSIIRRAFLIIISPWPQLMNFYFIEAIIVRLKVAWRWSFKGGDRDEGDVENIFFLNKSHYILDMSVLINRVFTRILEVLIEWNLTASRSNNQGEALAVHIDCWSDIVFSISETTSL